MSAIVSSRLNQWASSTRRDRSQGCGFPLQQSSRSSTRRGKAMAGMRSTWTARQTTAASSRISRLTAASMVSPGSTKPASAEYMPFGNLGWRTSRHASPSTASIMTTGSVRGKWIALQTGQSRLQPATATSVGAPQSSRSGGGRASASTPWPPPASPSDLAARGSRSRSSAGRRASGLRALERPKSADRESRRWRPSVVRQPDQPTGR